MSDIGSVATALADPTRRQVVSVLTGGPARTRELATATTTTASALSRHLAVLRKAGIVERADVDDDGRGREYRLVRGGLGEFGDWITERRWTDDLAARGPEPLTRRLLGRLGAFLDAFAAADRRFFARHLHDDVQLVFPDTPTAIGRQECIDGVDSHPVWRRYEIELGATGRHLGTHSHLTAIAMIEHAGDHRPRRVFSGALFVESRPWQLVHLQWTNAADPNGATGDTA